MGGSNDEIRLMFSCESVLSNEHEMIGGDRCYRDEYNDTNVYKTFFEPRFSKRNNVV